MKVILKKVVIMALILANYCVSGQHIDPMSGIQISNLPGDEVNSSWSPDGSKLIFSIEIDKNIDLGIYDFKEDTMVVVTDSNINFCNPVWHPDGNRIVFDSDHNGFDYIYTISPEGEDIEHLFNRDIACREAVFSSSSRQVYFTGFDALGNSWETYSYDFIYDNLNQITESKFGIVSPAISKNGKLLVCTRSNPFTGKVYLELLNWYGEGDNTFTDFEGEDVVWDEAGLKFYFIRKEDDSIGELFSIWKNGTHLEKLTNCDKLISSPSISPDGNRLAVSLKTTSG